MKRLRRVSFFTWLVVVLAMLGGVQFASRAAQASLDRAHDTQVTLAGDVELIRYYDELLTMSARVAAATGDRSYVERYRQAVPKLDRVIQEATSVVLNANVDRALAGTERANRALIALEERSFEQLAAGDRTGAYATVSSSEYERLKVEYGQGMDTVVHQLELAGANQRAAAARQTLLGWSVSLAASLFIVALWLFTARGRRRSDRARRNVEEELRFRALRDPLTGLANRTLLRDRIGIACSRRERGTAALLYIDLDDFKAVNDEHGHPAGDALLIEVARRLERWSRPADTVARLGGDEFALLVEGLSGPDAVPELARRLGRALSRPYDIGTVRVSCGASIGSFLFGESDPAPDVELALQKADLAMYTAKRGRKGSWVAFEQRMYDELIQHTKLKLELQRALDRHELVLRYQPVVDLRSGAVTGVEALLRWSHPERGMLVPADFLDVAEQGGLMPAISSWVLTEACGWAAARPARHDRSPLTVAVNVSASELSDSGLSSKVTRALTETGLDPHRLVLEVTETAVLGDIEASIEPIRALRGTGVAIAVDDFGTGYSSLAHLIRLPIDMIKVDKSFVDGLGIELENTHIVAGIIELAHELSLPVIAEGVESEEQLVLLRDLGCDQAQGFVLSRPVPGHAPLPSRRLREVVARLLGSADTAEPDGACYSVVIADHLESERRLIRRALERSKRFTVIGEAPDGPKALQLAAECRPDVVLVDINMPGGDGIAAVTRVLDAVHTTRVVLLSGYTTDDTATQGLNLGASAVIDKRTIDLAGALLDAIEPPVRRAS